jgi:hypothetical protein
MEAAMIYYPAIGTRLCDQRVEELRSEFGMVLADRIIEAEAIDFLWEARVSERYLGQQYEMDWIGDERDREISRVAVLSCVAGCWSAGLCLIDGDGAPVELVWKQAFESETAAASAFATAN